MHETEKEGRKGKRIVRLRTKIQKIMMKIKNEYNKMITKNMAKLKGKKEKRKRKKRRVSKKNERERKIFVILKR